MYQLESKKITDFSPLEVFRLFQLRCDIFVVEQNCPYPELDESDLICEHILLKNENQIIGTARIFPVENKKSKIGRVCIHKDHRSQQLGYPLVQKAIDEIISKGGKEIQISAQTHLMTFYQKLGFQTISESYLEDGIPHIDMRLIL